jgi:hypothetical protein
VAERGKSEIGEREPVANDEHLAILRRGSATWNEWRKRNGIEEPDLSEAKLRWADLSGVNLSEAKRNRANLGGADLSEANLRGAKLRGADLFRANLVATNFSEADLSGANLSEADLSGAVLNEANLYEADLSWVNLSWANLSQANIAKARLEGTVFGNVDLTQTRGLGECWHDGPCIIDFKTLVLSPNLPLAFLRGCGLPDNLIEYLPSLLGEAIRFYSCFISYSGKDQVFADKLYADLQDNGVRSWFAPHDLSIGAKTWDAIDEAIRFRDKLLLILSKASIASKWVGDEVNKAYAEERSRGEIVLFPVRIDDAVMSTDEPWAAKLRDQRNIGDFRQWKKPVEYQKSLERLLRDLKASEAG